MTVGDTVSLLPRDLGPGTSTSAATSALASSVGITWTSELLTVTGVDPTGPVSVQPNSLVSWGDGADLTRAVHDRSAHGDRAEPDTGQPAHPRRRPQGRARPGRPAHRVAQARPRRARSSSKPLAPSPISACWCPGPPASARPRWCARCARQRRLVELDGPEVGALRAEDRLASVSSAVATVRDGGGVLLITDVDALLPVDRRTRRHADPHRTAHRGGHAGCGVHRDVGGARRRRRPAARARSVRPRARA